MVPTLVSINVSRGGVPKQSVFEAFVAADGVEGDRQRDRRLHGGSDRAVLLYSLEVIQALQREGHSIAVGAAGENFTVGGIDWPDLRPGQEVEVGSVRLQITKYAAPCANIAHLFINHDYTRISQKRYPGWSRLCARVIVEGIVRMGDPIKLIQTRS
jgi:MOSC domain-containing protein YiiM